MNNSGKENYKYFININQWALKKYFNKYKVNKESYKKLKSNHYTLLFLLIDLYLAESLTKKEITGLTYTYISTGLIVDNLPMFFITNNYSTNEKEYKRLNRTIQNLLSRLKELNFLKIHIENNTKRYIYINSELLRLCNKGKYKLTPYDFVCKYWLKELKEIRTRNKVLLRNYTKIEKTFFENEKNLQIERKNFNIVKWDILPRLENYIKENIKDPYFLKRREFLNSK